MKKLAIIGGGNMGEALMAGIIRAHAWPASDIVVADKRTEALGRLHTQYGVASATSNTEAVGGAAIVLLAVKPQQMRDVLQEIKPLITPQVVVISIAAGISCAIIEKHLPPSVPVIRVMPNTPALVGEGASGLAKGRAATAAHLAQAAAILKTVGVVVEVEEAAIDAVTAVSGSGPAYVFYLAEAMKEAALSLGLAADVADRLVRQTILGAGKLLAGSAEEPQELRRRVTSPGGTTQAALDVLERGQGKTIFVNAIKRAAERSKELSQEASQA